ncbi:hypothetical protein NicSoilB4_02070 [Arthrobacter sp. NicSoilB4]|uniref:hypothetical protein n=1 Tax=Arthrobacter sp. NicSoilB4 TaxID=2830997 RepID=UPI001CC6AAB0|nr:hypothetical protein [Arthrobacter sp. NicSoilB4]BCW65444.1 hypothetical protein NicSoilB4_02070 [Arthrobacter sp. NicSoilB4]
MSDICFSGGAVAEAVPAAMLPAQALDAPRHCGMPMEWKAPAQATRSVYSFAPADAAAELPPLWRCGCGFQLDGIVHTPGVLSGLSR